ncbi:MAG: trehalose-6-phosphate synthase [Actinomycetota bacterium]|jgi:trehalose 6-phosphate synthase|nr:trehalose-6-phosphate synthase [Actinomycetota bacterium]
MNHELVVASNRGPISWSRDASGDLAPSRGFGGLVTALGGAMQDEAGAWISLALSDDDRAVAAEHPDQPFTVEVDGSRFTLRLLDAGDHYPAYYNEVANRLLWFTVHQLWGEPYEPSGTGWPPAWQDYQRVNQLLAEAVVAEAGGEVYLQDYHLLTAGADIRQALPDVALLHYIHTPWVQPAYLRRLPDPISDRVLRSLLTADVVAFSSPAWCDAFRHCAAEVLGAAVDEEDVVLDGRRTRVADFVLGVDADDLAASAASSAVATAGGDLDAELDGRKLILRVDRSDLSKNILRGLLAYELLLERRPEHRGAVWHYAHLNPSRQDVAEYRDYLRACRQAGERIQERFGESALTVYVGDDYPRAVAALQRSDVLLANPVTDGTNLVAKEGPALNDRAGVLILSPSAGAADVMAEGALLVNPYDVEAQAEALHRALTMGDDERAARARLLDAAARNGGPLEWFAAQRTALAEAVARR